MPSSRPIFSTKLKKNLATPRTRVGIQKSTRFIPEPKAAMQIRTDFWFHVLSSCSGTCGVGIAIAHCTFSFSGPGGPCQTTEASHVKAEGLHP